MNVLGPSIRNLEALVTAMAEEFDLATSFHEVWKPAVTDSDLHERMGKSYASQAFLVIRLALRREMLLALTRMWDSNKQGLRMKSLPAAIDEPGLLEALAQDRADHVRMPEVMPAMLVDLTRQSEEVKLLIRKYMAGGTHEAVLKMAVCLRHERLAHRQVAASTPVPDTFDADVEGFYADNSRIVALLVGLVKATAYDPSETADVYRHYATHFWAAARGEQTEGHPNYRKPTRS